MRRFSSWVAPAVLAIGRSYSTPGKVKVNVKTQDGTAVEFDAAAGTSLMEAIRDTAGLEMEGACNGCMQCSTCHVYVAQDWFGKIGKPSESELDLLDNALDTKDNSRLACQIMLSEAHSGIQVEIPKNVTNLLM